MHLLKFVIAVVNYYCNVVDRRFVVQLTRKHTHTHNRSNALGPSVH